MLVPLLIALLPVNDLSTALGAALNFSTVCGSARYISVVRQACNEGIFRIVASTSIENGLNFWKGVTAHPV